MCPPPALGSYHSRSWEKFMLLTRLGTLPGSGSWQRLQHPGKKLWSTPWETPCLPMAHLSPAVGGFPFASLQRAHNTYQSHGHSLVYLGQAAPELAGGVRLSPSMSTAGRPFQVHLLGVVGWSRLLCPEPLRICQKYSTELGFWYSITASEPKKM